jgi:hypothetical protein
MKRGPLFIPSPSNNFRTTRVAKAAAAGKMVGYKLPHFQLPAKGCPPTFGGTSIFVVATRFLPSRYIKK